MHVGHELRLARRRARAAHALAERDAKAAKRALVRTDDQFGLLLRVDHVKAGPEKARTEGFGQQAGRRRIAGRHIGFTGDKALDFCFQLLIALGTVLKPPGFDAAQQYPAIIEVYGGPHAQTVDRDWESLSDQYLARQGYVVFRLDNRGMANRGKRFEDVIFRQTGGPEVRDQLQGAEWLKSQPFIDGDRVAIQGWSYGGYMTLMTLLQAAPDVFAAAVAGAPVTDWSLYDTFYTERYMDTPQDNADGYEKSSVFYHLDRYEGELPPLLLVHGMADDNVTFDNTTRLMAAMQEKGLMFELMTYPGQRHGIRGQALQTHLMKTRMAFLNRALKRPGE